MDIEREQLEETLYFEEQERIRDIELANDPEYLSWIEEEAAKFPQADIEKGKRRQEEGASFDFSVRS